MVEGSNVSVRDGDGGFSGRSSEMSSYRKDSDSGASLLRGSSGISASVKIGTAGAAGVEEGPDYFASSLSDLSSSSFSLFSVRICSTSLSTSAWASTSFLISSFSASALKG